MDMAKDVARDRGARRRKPLSFYAQLARTMDDSLMPQESKWPAAWRFAFLVGATAALWGLLIFAAVRYL